MHRSRARLAPNSTGTVGQVYWRQPTNPLLETPAYVVEAMRNFAGTNEYGEPLWRMILADQHLVQRSGEWRETDGRDQVNILGAGKNGAMVYENRQIKPASVKHETRWVPQYPCDGWILERWFPPQCFGTPAAWAEVKSQDGVTPMMGPFPHRGDYWMMKGPWEEMPTLAAIRMGVASWENSVKHMHGKIDKALFDLNMKNFMKVLDEKKAVRDMKLTEKVKQMRTEMLRAVNRNPRLQAFRQELIDNGRAQIPTGF
jgi:hypothetical protein